MVMLLQTMFETITSVWHLRLTNTYVSVFMLKSFYIDICASFYMPFLF